MSDAPSVVERVRGIRGVSYAWRADTAGPRELGVIAQEVEEAFPEAVRTGADGYKQVDYLGLVAVLVEAVKELDARLTAVEHELGITRDQGAVAMAIQRIVLEVTEPDSELFRLTIDGRPVEDTLTAEPTQGPDGKTAHRVRLDGDVEAHRSYSSSDARLKTDIRPL